MRYRTPLLLPLLLLVACKPATSGIDPQPTAVPAPAAIASAKPAIAPVGSAVPTTAADEPEIAKSFNKDMTYSDLRKRLLGAGWLPLRDPQCWNNVGGEALVCNYLPEVIGCSADGYCKMSFANRELGLTAQVGTYGPSDKNNTIGNGTATAVRFWEFHNLDKPTAAACPSRDFDQFLAKFASDPQLARQFTAPLVKVVELRSDSDGDVPQPVYMLATKYDGFDLRYRDGAYHYVDADGKVDSASMKLNVTKQGSDKRLVRYLLNMSEGNSYRFDDVGGCWRLTEDPEAPSP